MADTKTYKITWQDGTVRYRKLSEEDHKRWKKLAGDDTSPVKAVEVGSPRPMNVAAGSPAKGS